jgi:multidrug efflux system outer membrane protein
MSNVQGATRVHCFFATACIIMLAGCTVGPNYHRPTVATAPAFEEPHVEASTQTQPDIAWSNWWTVFSDPVLNNLEDQAADANRDIKIAVAQVDESGAMARVAHSYQLPTIGADPSISRTRESLQRPNNGNTYGKAATYNDLLLPLTLSYEVDAWGKIRRMVQSANATKQATDADLRFVQLSVSASVAVDYYSLRQADAQLAIFDETVNALQQGYQIVDNQFQHGLVSELDVKQAETLLDQVRSQRDALHIQRDQLEHAIAELLGRTPEGFHIAVDTRLQAPPTIPAGVPSQLLERRPDIVASERSMASASAQIGVAKAAYFPQLSLTGFAGYESANSAAILNWQNTIASLGAGVVAPIFTGGRIRANLDKARAAYQASVSQYEKTVLISYQQVEDQLAALRFLANQEHDSASAVASARDQQRISLNRYNAGLVSYLNVIYAEQTLLDNEQLEAQVSGQRLIATVVLVKALGGGWEGRPSGQVSSHLDATQTPQSAAK